MIFLRRALSVTPAVGAMIAGGYFFYDKMHTFASTKVETEAPINYTYNSYFNDVYTPFIKWNKNWDKLVNSLKFFF